MLPPSSQRLLHSLQRWAPLALLLLVGLAIAIATVVTVYDHTATMGFPLDDSYIYLTYAKQFGRAEPFSYFPGGGYSAGSTSVIWPMLMAPFWTLGARGHALVWVSYGLCTALMLATVATVFAIVRRYAASTSGAVLSCVALLAIAPFSFTSLSGMEVALASWLLVTIIWLLGQQPSDEGPRWSLLACLAAAALSRPEASLLTFGVVVIATLQRLRRRRWRAAAWWAAALVPLVLWLTANKLLAGNLFPNTGVAKSHFYLPGFSWNYWFDVLHTGRIEMRRALFEGADSPLPWPSYFEITWLVGAAAIAVWAYREKRWLTGLVMIVTPIGFSLAIIASSGLWNFQNYRYIAPAFAVLVVPLGFAVGAVERCNARFVPKAAWLATVVAATLSVVIAYQAVPRLKHSARFFAQGVTDTNTQVVTIGEYIHEHLPDAKIMFHDAGAIAYYGDGSVFDMLGLVTNYQAGIANNGAGARFEFLESLPEAQRPTHFAYYPGWMGTTDFYGATVLSTPLMAQFAMARLAGAVDMQIIEARWGQHLSAEAPFTPHPGWRMVDRVDVADMASERAHQWQGALGARRFGNPSARWSFVARQASTPPADGQLGLPYVDGGRTIRDGRETFALKVAPTLATTLVLRSGGPLTQPYHVAADRAVEISVHDATTGTVVATGVVPPPDDTFMETTFVLPAGVTHITVTANAPYRVFHWFALQPADK